MASRRTTEIYIALDRAVRALQPSTAQQTQLYGAMLHLLDQAADWRDQRIDEADNGLGTEFWWAIAALLVALLVLAALAPTEKIVSEAGAMCALGIIVALVLIYDGPFKGESHVEPDQFGAALKMIHDGIK